MDKYCVLSSRGEIIHYKSNSLLKERLLYRLRGYPSVEAFLSDLILPHESLLSICELLSYLKDNLTEVSIDFEGILTLPNVGITIGPPKGLHRATLVKNPTGKSYTVTFRHPLVLDNTGATGRKVKKGLGTDLEKAEKVVGSLNVLLGDRALWDVEALKKSLEQEYNPAIAIFLSNIKDSK